MLLCDGQTISADDYPELVAALGSNVLPNLNGRVLQGSSTAGEYKEAGLPNITGTTKTFNNNGDFDVFNGCFERYVYSSNNVVCGSYEPHTESTPIGALGFNASRSNSIYGASSTVQPPAYTVRYYICYG